MSEREPQNNETAWKEFSSLIGNLPLDKCSREHTQVTNQWGWRAPKDKTFRVTGHFVIYSDQSAIEDMYMPSPSVDILKEENSKKYEEFLKEADGDEKEAMDLLIDDIYFISSPDNVVSYFDGKWLVIDPDLKQSFQREEGKLKMPTLKMPEVMVKSDVEAWTERSYLGILHDIAPQSPVVTEVLFKSQVISEYWEQYYAKVVLGKCKIELIDCVDKEKKLYVSKPDDKTFLLPEGTRKKGTYSDNEFAIRTTRRPTKDQEIQLVDFNERNTNLLFIPQLKSDLIIAKNSNRIIVPERKKKKTRDIPF